MQAGTSKDRPAPIVVVPFVDIAPDVSRALAVDLSWLRSTPTGSHPPPPVRRRQHVLRAKRATDCSSDMDGSRHGRDADMDGTQTWLWVSYCHGRDESSPGRFEDEPVDH
jgi:hypothetical protein